MSTNQSKNTFFSFNSSRSIGGVVVAIFFFVLLFFLARGVFQLLSYAAPFLLVATLIINYRVVVSYGRWLINLLQRNPLGGLLAVILTLVGFPVVSAFLFIKALFLRKLTSASEQFRQEFQQNNAGFRNDKIKTKDDDEPNNESEYIQYEEIVTRKNAAEVKKEKSPPPNDYEQLFD